VVFDTKLIFTLPSNLIIYGHCSFSNNIGIPMVSNCSNVSANSIAIVIDIDQNMMIPQNIMYTISLSNVSTPSSLASLLYTLTTTFNGTSNQKFSILYSMQTPFPINLVSSKTNYTIN
jgi:hypothetical protein